MTTPNIALLQKFGNKPMFMQQSHVAHFVNTVVSASNSEEYDYAADRQPLFRAKWYRHPEYSHVAVLPVKDVLYHEDRDYYFGQSYEGHKANLLDIFEDDSITAIAEPHDCYGGTAAGCGSTEQWKRENQIKPIFSLVDEAMYSASMYVAAPAHEIHMLPSSGNGSIGTVIPFMDYSGMLEKIGIKFEAIRSGDRKYRGNGMEELDDETRAEMQADVDELAGQFIEAVATNRSEARSRQGLPAISADQIKSYEAKTFIGQQAVDAGLADSVMATPEHFYQHVAESVAPPIERSIHLPTTSQTQEFSMPGTTKPTGDAGAGKKQYTEEEMQARVKAAEEKAEREAEKKLVAKQEQERKDREAEDLRAEKEARDRKEKIEASDAFKGREQQAKAYIDGDLKDLDADKAIGALGNAPLDPVKRSNMGKQLDEQNSNVAPNANNDTDLDDEAEEMVQFQMAHGMPEAEAREKIKAYQEREARSSSQTAEVPFQ